MDLNLGQEVSNRFSLDLLLVPTSMNKEDEVGKGMGRRAKSQPDNSPVEDILNNTLIEPENLERRYGLMAEMNTTPINYESLFSYLEHQARAAEKDESQTEEENSRERDSSDSPTFSEERTKETVAKIMMGYLTGNQENISPEEKESYHFRQMFNTSFFLLYRRLSPVSFQ